MSLSSPLTVRATIPQYADIDAYYATVPSCALSCEKDFWGVRINSPACAGDGKNFACFCKNSVLASTDLIFTLADARQACAKKQCPESEYNNVDLATIRLTAFCTKIAHPDATGIDIGTAATTGTATGTATGTKATGTGTGTSTGTNTATGASSAATPTSSSRATSFSPSKSLVVFGSLIFSLGVFAHV